MFEGCLVAIVTPFHRSKIDQRKLSDLIKFLLNKGVNGIVPCGTTGESPTLSFAEHKHLIELTLTEVGGRIPVIAGTGSNSTQEALELTSFAKQAGADGALVITPYYNKPTPSGMEAHFQELNKIGLPIIIYNVPSRTGVNISPGTVAKLSRLKNIVGIKEASGNMDQVSSILSLSSSDFTVLSGNDSHTLPILSLGGKGVISVVANIVPVEMTKMVSSFLTGHYQRAQELHYQLYPLCQAMFIETNPLPIKTAMARLGMIEKEWRLPLSPMKKENEVKVEEVLQKFGLIKEESKNDRKL